MKIKNKISIIMCGSIAVSRAKVINEEFSKFYNVNLIFTESASKLYFNEFNESVNKISNFNEHNLENIDDSKAIIIYAATYNTINQIANNIKISKIISKVLNFSKPIIIVPAMNNNMYTSEILTANINILQNKKNYTFINPILGKLREGHTDIGHVADTNEILLTTEIILSGKLLKNTHVVVASGHMSEMIINNVVLTNLSSSTFAFYFVKHLKNLGAQVIWLDNSNKQVDGVKKIFTNSNNDMINNSLKYLQNNSFYFSLTAGSDFITKDTVRLNDKLQVNFSTNKKIINSIQQQIKVSNVKYIGFKLSNNREDALKLMNRHKLDYVIWNQLNTINSLNICCELISENKCEIINDNKLNTSYKLIKSIFNLKSK